MVSGHLECDELIHLGSIRCTATGSTHLRVGRRPGSPRLTGREKKAPRQQGQVPDDEVVPKRIGLTEISIVSGHRAYRWVGGYRPDALISSEQGPGLFMRVLRPDAPPAIDAPGLPPDAAGNSGGLLVLAAHHSAVLRVDEMHAPAGVTFDGFIDLAVVG